jgi:hypothetical protein
VVAFVASVLVSVLLIGGGVLALKRRPAGKPTSWGEAMVGATYTFGTLFWVFGVVPHQWILWADADLGWTVDRFMVGPGDVLENLPFVVPYSALRDIVVVLIHVVYVAIAVIYAGAWQNRGKSEPVVETSTSDYGRPLVRADA